jgi:hypothetical protein
MVLAACGNHARDESTSTVPGEATAGAPTAQREPSRDAPPAPPDGPARERVAVLDATAELGAAIVEHGCSDLVMGHAFRGARILCLGATASALTSSALEDPARTGAVVAQLAALIPLGLAAEARAPFRSTGATAIDGRELPRSVLYRGLLGLVLAAHERLAPGTTWTPLFDALAESLADDLAGGWRASYGTDQIWPCDHAPAASVLRLHAQLRRSPRSAAAADAVAARLRAALDAGFPTRVGRRGEAIERESRGTALAFTAGFLLPAEPALARAFAERLVERCDRTGLAACREWPRGIERPGDTASGAIKNGYAVGATALALAATRALDDPGWNQALLDTVEALGGGSLDARRQPLELALVRWGQTAASWRTR